MQKKKLIFTAILSSTLLTACNGEPSQSEIESAMNKAIEEQNSHQSPNFSIKMDNIKKLKCGETKVEGVYECEVNSDISSPMKPGEKKNMDNVITFKKVDGKWVAGS